MQRLLRSGLVQGQPVSTRHDGRSEQEAYLVASRMARAAEQERVSAPTLSRVQESTSSGPLTAIGSALGSGEQLPDAIRASFESRLQAEFGDVRLHTDAVAARSALAANARAFTVGRDIVFGAGEYAPGTTSGIALLAHELTHVIQQRSTGPVLQRVPLRDAPHRVNVTFDEEALRYTVLIDGIPVAEVAVEHPDVPLDVRVDISDSVAVLTVRHWGGASLAPAMTAEASAAFSLSLNEVDLRSGPPSRRGPAEPVVPGAGGTRLVPVTIAPPSTLHLPGEPRGELGFALPAAPGALSEFEEDLRAHPGRISGVVPDPDTGEVIGYRVPATTGVTRLVDREGNEVFLTEIGLETPVVDPIDFIPTPGTATKVGAGIGVRVGTRLGIRALGREAAEGGLRVSVGVIARMRGVSRALARRAAREIALEVPSFVRRITKEALDHTFDRHAAEWFGRAVSRTTHLGAWRELIERAALSSKIFAWSAGPHETIAHLAWIEGKPFVVEFYKATGELATAFIPNARQLAAMRRLLGMLP